MRLKTCLSLFLLFSFAVSNFAKSSNPNFNQLKKEQIIRSINLLRAAHKQPAITFEGIYKQAQTAGLNKIAGGGSIAGVISGVSERYIYSASVVAWRSDAELADSTGTSTAYFGKVEPNGRYVIHELEPGDYYVLALADTYVPKFYNNVTDFSDATTVPVREGETTGGVDFFLEQINSGRASLSGKVTAQFDGHPIARAYVNVFSPDNPFFYGWTETRDDGTYEITGMKSGKYYAYVWADGYLNEYYQEAATFDAADAIDVVEPNHYDGIDFTLSRGGMISGVVTTVTGKPLSGIYVQAYTDFRPDGTIPQPDSGVGVVYGYGSAITDESGFYQIVGLPAGDYIVSAQMWNQWFYLIEYYDNVTDINEAIAVVVETEVETPGIDFDLDVPTTFGTIFGKVVDANDDPIAGAVVQAHAPFDWSSGGVQVWAYGYTDHRGNYTIDNLPDGEYLVSAYAQVGWQYVNRYWPDAETPEEAMSVIVNGATDRQPTNFKLPIRPGTARISGRVLRHTGEPILYAYIQLTSADATLDPANGATSSIWAYASTDSNGSYRIQGLPAGEYVAYSQYWENQNFAQQWFDHKDSRSEATLIVLADGAQRDDINFDLTLRPYYGAIAGTVTDEVNGAPIARAYVEITPIGFNYFEDGLARPSIWPGFWWPYHAITNEFGNYQVEWLPQGEYYVSVYSNGAFEYFENAPVPELAAKVKVVGGETTAVNFALTPRDEGDGVISGTVTDEWNSGALQIAMVIARPVATPAVFPDSEKFFNTITQTDGSYELTGLPAGDYYLFSFAPGYIGEYYDNVYDPSEAKVIAVVENQPVTGIDFALSPILWLRGCPECDLAAPGASGGAQVFGKVTDGNGKPIRSATIYLLNDTEKAVSFAQSNAEGLYELHSVPPGRYRAKATHLNFKGEFNNGVANFADAQVIEVGYGALEINFVLDSVTSVEDEPPVPTAIELYGNYPNPFNPETLIKFGLPAEMTVRLRIFNLLGQEVRTLEGGRLAAGQHAIRWDGRDLSGAVLPSGIYFYTLEANGQLRAVQKMMLLK